MLCWPLERDLHFAVVACKPGMHDCLSSV
jgi:hypothetical protein